MNHRRPQFDPFPRFSYGNLILFDGVVTSVFHQVSFRAEVEIACFHFRRWSLPMGIKRFLCNNGTLTSCPIQKVFLEGANRFIIPSPSIMQLNELFLNDPLSMQLHHHLIFFSDFFSFLIHSHDVRYFEEPSCASA
jgi:hypothetical protein